MIEPGGARTEYRYGSARVTKLMPIYTQLPLIASCGWSIPRTGWLLVVGTQCRAHQQGHRPGARVVATDTCSRALKGTLTQHTI